MVHRARIFLIRAAKILPFLLCAIVCASWLDCLRALVFHDFAIYEGALIPHTPLNWWIASLWEYGLFVIVIILWLAIAMETCIYNKMACGYIAFNWCAKPILTMEVSLTFVYITTIINILISGYLVLKGLQLAKRR